MSEESLLVLRPPALQLGVPGYVGDIVAEEIYGVISATRPMENYRMDNS